MAARTSTSVGVGATIVILGVAAFVLFVLTIIFFGKMGKLEKELADLQQSTSEFVRDNERQSDAVRRFADLAARERKSVIGYLVESHLSTMGKVTGSAEDSYEQFETKLVAFENVGGSLLQSLRDRDTEISTQQRQLADAQSALSAAEQNLLNETERVDTIRLEFNEQQAAMASEVGLLKDQVESYRRGVNDLGIDMEARLERCRNDARATESRMRDEVRVVRAENLRLQDIIARLQQEKSKDLVSPTDEFALVDGFVAGINPVSREASINLGSRDKIKLGMTFAVYADATSIRPDKNGNYPRPKGELEVIRINANSATCRILTELKGNPIIRGDVIANPVYDPKKVYTFLVYGNFDINSDGVYSSMERSGVEAMISEWGGKITDELTGDVDFLVLGARPVLPPSPTSSARPEIQMEYIRLRNVVDRYNELHDKAAKTSLPILNLNRLETLLVGR